MSAGRLTDRVLGLLSWAKVATTRAAAAALGRVKTTSHHDDELDVWQSYGFQSRGRPGADAIVVSMGSHADQRIAILVGDRRYTIALEEGEVAIVDDLGQRVHLTRTGIVVDAPAIKIGAGALLGAARATDPVGPSASMTTWMTQVSGYINGALPGTIAPPLPTSLGTITSGSSQTQIE